MKTVKLNEEHLMYIVMMIFAALILVPYIASLINV